MSANTESGLIDVNAAAEVLGLSPRTLRVWAGQRKIASHRLGTRLLFSRSELHRIIRESESRALGQWSTSKETE